MKTLGLDTGTQRGYSGGMKTNDQMLFTIFLAKLASDSLANQESEQQYKERLEALRELLDERIEAIS